MAERLGVPKGQDAAFARRYVRLRLTGGFMKDIAICLRGVPRKDGKRGFTHAYFPALAHCCSMLEYLSGLRAGTLRPEKQDVIAFADAYMPDYEPDAVRVLVDALRNTINHRGIANAVWVDPHHGHNGRRLTWFINAGRGKVAIEIRKAPGVVLETSPWPCPYTHRVHVWLSTLRRDIVRAGKVYADAIPHSSELERRFMKCMQGVFPPQ